MSSEQGRGPGEGEDVGELLRASLGVLRVGAEVAGRIGSLGLRTGAGFAVRVLDAARTDVSAAQVLEETVTDVRRQARDVLGLPAEDQPAGPAPRRGSDDPEALRRRGRELLRRSVDIDYQEPVHPAYDAILDVLAPDEARLLRHLARHGAEPSVDVRAAQLGARGELVAPGITLIGDRAGCRFQDRVPGYLNNLHRLGLVWFSREPLPAERYRMLEAQPPVQEALKAARRTRTIRRSIHLTPFGEDFVQACLPIDEDVV